MHVLSGQHSQNGLRGYALVHVQRHGVDLEPRPLPLSAPLEPRLVTPQRVFEQRGLFVRKRPLPGCRQQLRQSVGGRRIRRGPQHRRQMRIVVVLNRRLLPNHPVGFQPRRRNVLPRRRIPDRGDSLADRSTGGCGGLPSARHGSFLFRCVAADAVGMVPRGIDAIMRRPVTLAAADRPPRRGSEDGYLIDRRDTSSERRCGCLDTRSVPASHGSWSLVTRTCAPAASTQSRIRCQAHC